MDMIEAAGLVCSAGSPTREEEIGVKEKKGD